MSTSVAKFQFVQFLSVLNEKKRKIKELRDEIDALNGEQKSADEECEEPKGSLIKAKSKNADENKKSIDISLRFDDDENNNDTEGECESGKTKGLSLTQKRFLIIISSGKFFFFFYKLH